MHGYYAVHNKDHKNVVVSLYCVKPFENGAFM